MEQANPSTPEFSEAEIFEMMNKYLILPCFFDVQTYMPLMTEIYYVWLSKVKDKSGSKKKKGYEITLHSGKKMFCYKFDPRPKKKAEEAKLPQKGERSEQIMNKAKQYARKFLQFLKIHDLCYKKQEIATIVDDMSPYLKSRNQDLKGLRKIIRTVVITLFIERVFFNEYFQKPDVNEEIHKKYEKQLEYLRSLYKKQVQGLKSSFVIGEMAGFYIKYFNDLRQFPISERRFTKDYEGTIPSKSIQSKQKQQYQL